MRYDGDEVNKFEEISEFHNGSKLYFMLVAQPEVNTHAPPSSRFNLLFLYKNQ
jgi:hypothetical protein